jgi:hypothetical protein
VAVLAVTGSFSFHTGWPGTGQHTEQITLPGGGSQTIIVPDPIYGLQLPNYYRIDARLTKRTTLRGGDLRLFLEVSNLTNRSNVFGYDYFQAPNATGPFVLKRDAEGGFPIVPSIGVSWTGWR